MLNFIKLLLSCLNGQCANSYGGYSCNCDSGFQVKKIGSNIVCQSIVNALPNIKKVN